MFTLGLLITMALPGALAVVPRLGIQCFVLGECLDSQILDTAITNTSRACLERCQSIQGCEWFTFYADSKICTSLSGCLDLTVKKCKDNCISGEKECPEILCGIQGRCFGALEGIRKVGSAQECGGICANRMECLWHSYDPMHASCTMTNDCPALDKSCQGCTVSETECTAEGTGTTAAPSNSNKGTYLNYVGSRLIALNLTSMEKVECQEAKPHYSNPNEEALVTIIDGTLLRVEQIDANMGMKYYDPDTKKWLRETSFGNNSLSKGVLSHLTAVLSDGTIVGFQERYRVFIGINRTNTWQQSMPNEVGVRILSGCCLATVEGDYVFVSGGIAASTGSSSTIRTVSNKVFRWHPLTKDWKEWGKLSFPVRNHACGAFKTNGGTKIFIYGGQKSLAGSLDESIAMLFDWTTQKADSLDGIKFNFPLGLAGRLWPVAFEDTFLMPFRPPQYQGGSILFYKWDYTNPENAVKYFTAMSIRAIGTTFGNGIIVPPQVMLPCT